MTIVYLIVAHHDIKQLTKLINALDHPNALFVIHLDAKFDIDIGQFERDVCCCSKIHIVEERNDVRWGGFMQVQVTLQLLSIAVNQYTPDYITLLSGQDFPLKPHSYIFDFLEKNRGKEFIDWFSVPDPLKWPGRGGVDRYEYYWFIDEIGLQQSLNLVDAQRNYGMVRAFPEGYQSCGGSSWFTITSACARYITDLTFQQPDLVQFFKFCLCPDELFFQTLILNSPFRHSVVNNNLRYIDWSERKAHPKVLGKMDLEKMIGSSHQFARKFDTNTDEEVVDIIGQLIKNPIPSK
jgi:hypothetical protein